MDVIRDGCFNASRVCRFCLSQSGVMSPIFDQGETNVATKIMALARIQLFVNDGLPSVLCHKCLYLAEKFFEFKNQIEASDAMLKKYLAMVQAPFPSHIPMEEGQKNIVSPSFLQQGTSTFCNDSPHKRKRGRPRKEENLIFYSSPARTSPEPETSNSSQIKMVDGIASLVTVVDPRSENLSNSDEDLKKEIIEHNEIETPESDTARSLAIARAKAKKYMGVVINVDENGTKTRRHLCKGCGKTFGHCSDLRKHVLVHTGERPFHCQLCNKTFSRSTNLNKHLKVHSGQKPFACTDCPKSFASKGDLQRHLVIHSGIKPFRCHLCHQCFSRKDKLTRHVKLHGNPLSVRVNSNCGWTGHNIGIAPYENGSTMQFADGDSKELEDCNRQGDEIDEDSSEGTEKSSRGDENDNDCPEDVESMVINIDPFPLDGELQDTTSHTLSKTRGETLVTPFRAAPAVCNLQCSQCAQIFENTSDLASHILGHLTDKPHKCGVCAKSFTRKRELVRHETVHTGVKPFSCPTCFKAFARKDKLARHKKIHDVPKQPPPLFCEICAVAFFNETLFKEHMDSHDAGDYSNGIESEEDQFLWRGNGCVESDDGNSEDEVQ